VVVQELQSTCDLDLRVFHFEFLKHCHHLLSVMLIELVLELRNVRDDCAFKEIAVILRTKKETDFSLEKQNR
jgi:hypothetical protein